MFAKENPKQKSVADAEAQPTNQKHRIVNYRRYLLISVLILFLVFGAGMKYHAYITGGSVTVDALAGQISSTSGFENVVASTDIVVKIEGEVAKPGYYSIDNQTSLRDLIEYVGVTSDGDISDFDFLHKPMQGDTYYVKSRSNPVDVTPWLMVAENNNSDSSLNEPVNTDLININTATASELMELDGIGEVRAQAIIDYRNKYGDFQRIEDIMAVKGIGEKIYAGLKDFITVE